MLKTLFQNLLWLLAYAGIFGLALFIIFLVDYFQTQHCPYCARGWAIRKRGRDLVCRRCARDIDRRIRATADDAVPSRPRLLK